MTNGDIQALAVSGQSLFAGTNGAGVFLSTNNGASWTTTNTGLTMSPYVQTFAVSGTDLFAGTEYGGVYLSTDNGTSWTDVNFGLTNTDIRALAVSGQNLFAGSNGSGVFLSTNNGSSWNAINSGLPILYVNALAASGTDLFAGTDGFGVYFSTNSGTSWSSINSFLTSAIPVEGFAVSGANLYVAANAQGYAFSGHPGVFHFTRTGTHWSVDSIGLNDFYVRTLALSGSNLFAGTIYGVYLSTDNGITWAGVSPQSDVYALAVSGTNVFAGTEGDGVFLSTDNGTRWNPVNFGLPISASVRSLSIVGTNLFAGIDSSVVLPGSVWTTDMAGGVWRRPLSEMITAVDDNAENIISSFSLAQNFPNPFNPSTVIRYQLPMRIFVSLKVFDVLGREVVTLVSEPQNTGVHSVTFNAVNFSSGVYFYRLRAGTYHDSKKFLLLK